MDLRLSHSWSEGTSSGTSRDTLRLTLNNHNTADPNVIPTNSIVNLKVYDDAPTGSRWIKHENINDDC